MPCNKMYLQAFFVVFLPLCIDCQSLLDLAKGDVCKKKEKEVWRCVPLKECPQIGDFRTNRPAICSFEGIEPIICCPPASSNSVSSDVSKSNSNASKHTAPPQISVGNTVAPQISASSVTVPPQSSVSKVTAPPQSSVSNTVAPQISASSVTVPPQSSVGNVTVSPQSSDGNIAEPAQISENSNYPQLKSNGYAQKLCFRYFSNLCSLRMVRRDAARATHVVVGGVKAKPREHKYMVLIGYGNAESKAWNCGGSLISEMWVVSAAHCSTSYSLGPAKWARLGDLDISRSNDDALPQEKMIVERIVHPKYRPPQLYNDIALFKLDSKVTFNSWVGPICLSATEDNVPIKAKITGWGRIDFAGDVSSHLQEVVLPVVDGTECRSLYTKFNDSKIPRGIDPVTMICAGETEGGKDACTGDSGGPLFVSGFGCLGLQIGVTSFGRDCGLPNSPGVYTKVAHYTPWIEHIISYEDSVA